ncbi:MAG: methyltransferase domain-containing protein [Acidobacteriaceae bacterium]
MVTTAAPASQDFPAAEIARFWNDQPCLTDFLGAKELEDILDEHDRYKDRNEPHTAEQIRSIDWNQRRVLEIGPGQGYEAERIARAGAQYNAIDLTPESIRRVQTRFRRAGLAFQELSVMNAEAMTFPDNSFDIVFTHGVIHHSPHIDAIISEIHRILRPGGMMVAMVYHRNSLNYHISIRLLRRAGIFLLLMPGMAKAVSMLTHEPPDRLAKHLHNLRQDGLQYLTMRHFIHKATDGPENVYSAVFTDDDMRALCASFRSVSVSKHFLNERHFPVLRSMLTDAMRARLAAAYGWHLWVTATK